MFYTLFRNRDKECFGTALANYLDMNGEGSLADKVYEDFRQHPFVRQIVDVTIVKGTII